ncbi:MAG: T9SS type A sorting domain-containing protein [Bacteroidia bacterium]
MKNTSPTFLLLVALMGCLINANAQNMVPNPGFEELNTCPSEQSQLNATKNWHSLRETPDYFNTCAKPGMSPTQFNAGIPRNTWGYQPAAYGEGYAGIMLYYSPQVDFREFLTVKLKEPLISGRRYQISFVVSLANHGGRNPPHMSCNNLGILFNFGSIEGIPNFAHAFIDTLIEDTLQWVEVKFNYLADQAYTHLAIGNFFDDANTIKNKTSFFSQYAFYYIDEVKVIANRPQIVIHPNPVTEQVFITSSEDFSPDVSCKMYSVNGQRINIEAILHSSNQLSIYFEAYRPGIYILRLRDKAEVWQEKILKI